MSSCMLPASKASQKPETRKPDKEQILGKAVSRDQRAANHRELETPATPPRETKQKDPLLLIEVVCALTARLCQIGHGDCFFWRGSYSPQSCAENMTCILVKRPQTQDILQSELVQWAAQGKGKALALVPELCLGRELARPDTLSGAKSSVAALVLGGLKSV